MAQLLPVGVALLCLTPALAEAQSQSTATNQTPPATAVSSPPATAASATAGAAPSADSGGLQEVVVTAQRRSERLQNVPIAVTAVTAARLEAVGIQTTQDLAAVVPGLSVPQTGGYTQPHIRGVGTTVIGPGIENPVATYIDGVYIANAPSSLLTLDNIDRIEVLKGPQGTLFGRNSTGGLIQLVTRDPKEAPAFSANLSYGNYNDVTADVYAGGAVAKDLAADIAVRYEHQGDGFGRNLYTGQEVGSLDHDFAGRIKLVYQPSSDTTLKLALDYEDRDTTRDLQHLDKAYPGTFNNAAFGGPYPQGRAYDVDFDQPFGDKLQGGGISLQVNQKVGAFDLLSLTAYRQSIFDVDLDLDLIPRDLISARPEIAHDLQFSQEFQLSPQTTGRLKWVTGLYYFHALDGWRPLVIAFGPSPVSTVPGVATALQDTTDQTTNSVAGYAQATYEIVRDTNLTLGGRYTYEAKSINGTEIFSVAGAPVSTTPFPVPGLGIPTSIDFSRFNYRLALDHKFGPNVLAYLSYNTGFKSGGFNSSDSTNQPYKPESIKAVEAGLKNELFDHRFRLNIAAYHYDYTNIQIERYIQNNFNVYNGAGAELYGVDLDGELILARGLSLTGGFAYIHDRFTDFPVADYYYYPVAGCTPVPGGICNAPATGKHLPFTPTRTFNLGLDYKINTQYGRFGADSNFSSSSEFFSAPDNYAKQKAYGVLNASVFWTEPNAHWTVKGYVKNLTGTVYATALVEASQGVTEALGYPRTYGVTIGYKY